jgi:repressor LexA
VSDLKPKEQKILLEIQNHVEVNGFPPTVRELVELVGEKSTSIIHHYLESLESKGFLHKRKNVSRGLKLLKPLNNELIEKEEV